MTKKQLNNNIKLELKVIEWSQSFSDCLYQIPNYKNWEEGKELSKKELEKLYVNLLDYNKG